MPSCTVGDLLTPKTLLGGITESEKITATHWSGPRNRAGEPLLQIIVDIKRAKHESKNSSSNWSLRQLLRVPTLCLASCFEFHLRNIQAPLSPKLKLDTPDLPHHPHPTPPTPTHPTPIPPTPTPNAHTPNAHTQRPHPQRPHPQRPHLQRPHTPRPHTPRPHPQRPHPNAYIPNAHTPNAHTPNAHTLTPTSPTPTPPTPTPPNAHTPTPTPQRPARGRQTPPIFKMGFSAEIITVMDTIAT
ncbi:uncharacterized protein LOC134778678 [Penaeus indicus]|uniref:uncharacterized protein LOC134778678 n=1 Tax=Penaeus indicus TaxID=29960 RepID=UPI00300D6684